MAWQQPREPQKAPEAGASGLGGECYAAARRRQVPFGSAQEKPRGWGGSPQDCATLLDSRQHNPLLLVVFSLFVFVGDFADLVGFEEEDLADAFMSIDA